MAEQLAAEELRRRDPVKKAFWLAGLAVALMLLWALYLGLNVRSESADLADLQLKWAAQTNTSLQASNAFRNYLDLEDKLKSLGRYATNRFLWANALNALQYTTVTNVRLVSLTSVEEYTTNALIKVSTNVVVPVAQPARWWQFGASAPPATNLALLVTNQIRAITNAPRFLTNHFPATAKVDVTTNRALAEATAHIEILKPLTTTTRRALLLTAKDYSVPAGQQIVALTNALLASDYFKRYLAKTNLTWDSTFTTEDENPFDSANPRPFISFTVRCQFPEVIHANE